MADIPTPRSYNQILGEMIAAFLAKYPIENLKVGGPILTMLEAAAQSDLRNTSDIFKFLASVNLDSAEGDALTKILNDEGTDWLGSVASTGYVTIGDSRYTKKASTIYFGLAAPIVGSASVNVADAAGWPGTGFVYVGRNTSNYEGPLQYASITDNGTYFTINFSPGVTTTRFHNLGESVILAQGGNRPITVGARVSNADGSISFTVKYAASLLDGETELEGVQVVCTQAGTIGNAPAGSINTWVSAPFSGATVTNPLPFTNGFDAESAEQARARVRKLRKARAKGTASAIEAYLAGVTSVEESKRITSVKVVEREGVPATAYIDDGTGYEEKTAGVAYEVLTDFAVGGEQYFQLELGRPIAKAFNQTSLSEPFAIVDGSLLAVQVGGVVSTVTFQDSMFRSPGNAEAYEVVHAINAAPDCLFSARLSDNGIRVTIFAKNDTNEDIQIVSVPGTVNANAALGFPLGWIESVALYKNDILLSKDGRPALIEGNAQSSWMAMTSGDTIKVNVDGTGENTYTINDVDFVNASTGYLSVASTNSLEAWAKVLNYKIPGVTVTVVANRLEMVSNLGPDARGSLAITGGDLVVANMFPVESVSARARDYTLNRNTGQLRLVDPLVVGDKLTAGTNTTTAFLESESITTTITSTDGYTYWLVDSDAQWIPLPIVATTTFESAAQLIVGAPDHERLISNEDVFADAQIGDWLVLADMNLGSYGSYRISHKVSDKEVWYAKGTPSVHAPSVLASNGLVCVRTSAPVQPVEIPPGDYTAQGVANLLNGLEGAHGEVVRTGHFRAIADTRDGGNIMFLVAEVPGYLDRFPVEAGVSVTSEVSHNAFAEAGNPENDIPTFAPSTCSSSGGANLFHVPVIPLQMGNLVTGLRTLVYNGTDDGYGNVLNYVSAIVSQANGANSDFSLRESFQSGWDGWLLKDRVFFSRPYAIGPKDDLSVVLDGDIHLKRFEIPMGRKLDLTNSTYNAAGMVVADGDAGTPFGTTFGDTFSFEDYALFMHPRVITDAGAGMETMWRWKELGAGGENTILRFDYPTTPNTPVDYSVRTGLTQANPTILSITLPSTAARVFGGLNPTTRIARQLKGAVGNLSKAYFYCGLNVHTWQVDAAGEVTLVITAPDAKAVTAFGHGLQVGDVVYLKWGGPPVGPLVDGPVTITGVAAAPGPQVNVIKYQIGGPQVPSGPNLNDGSYLYFDPAGPQLHFIGSVAGDALYAPIWSSTTFDTPLYVNNASFVAEAWTLIEVYVPSTGLGTTTTVVWSDQIGTDFVEFPLGLMDLTAIDASWPVTVMGAGGFAPQNVEATWVTEQEPNPTNYVFKDGLNYVKYTTPIAAPADFTIDLKNPVDAGLTGNPYWTDEDAYLVPLTADNIRDYLNVLAVTGLSDNADVRTTSGGEKVQIVTDTNGRDGKVEILGGLASEAMASVVGNGSITGDTLGCYVVIPTTSLPGFQATWAVELVNANGELKPAVYSWNADLVSIAGNTFTFGTDVGDYEIVPGFGWQFERHGRYMAIVWNGLGPGAPAFTYGTGDFLVVQNNGVVDTVSPGNCGVFTIIRADLTNNIFWVENANGVEERARATLITCDRDSVMPGDILSVGTDAWGVTNKRAFTVATVNYTTKLSFTVAETPAASVAVVPAQPLITLRAGTPFKAVKTVTAIAPYTDPDFTVLVFGEDPEKYPLLSSANGTQVKALSKLAFPAGISEGKDGYDYNTGLIGEANRVLYGLETDHVTYPGVVAAGASVNINGPVVRKIEISLALRLRNGANKQATFDAVRSAIATFINSLDIGTPVAIADIISVANQVGGVEAVSVSSPVYGVTSDLISVQPYEKPMILQPDLDITLTLIA